MAGPCVRVKPTNGEATRQRLAAAGLIDDDRQITEAEGWLYIPVNDSDRVPEELDVIKFEVPEREPETTPADFLDFDPSYERLGDAVLIDEDDPDRAERIAEAVLSSDLPAETVLNRESKIKGEERVRDWDVIAGTGTEVVHREYGHEYRVDLAEAYFSPRLATERHRVSEQIQAGEHVLDMFAGVGPFAIPAAARGAEVVAVDLNPSAIEALQENAERNGVADSVTAIHADVRDIADEYRGWADRLIMNLPHSAATFLETAVSLAGDDCVVHYYDIQHEDDPFGRGETAIRAAAEPEYDVDIDARRVVRSYAPHEVNIVIDARLRRAE
ncbi:MAG: class I SAM-dependent methyltransferase family protein [Salinirussus sp.]